MTSTTYHSVEIQAQTQPGIGDALKELATAARHLLVAVLAKVSAPAGATVHPGNRAEEAAEARTMADRFLRTDPRMAADIYCAADRHERLDQ